ncbi:hypothetical protein H7I41_16770 [Mycobacterium manitobense]|uniref:Uncharacterized protein n=1 Tax=[Mycobacterium] manitobense TaxID=190147 RepID=A0A9X3BNI3_9MYCO|nr:hypothetical protein [[Mycobacterium] manitobense]MCV7171569.1 hypothetical protein [[Mycobacterium] manitobense]
MPMYVRHTRAVQMGDLAPQVRDKLTAHAEANQLDVTDVRMWLTHSENPPADKGFGKLMRRRANSADPDAEHDTVAILHPTHVLVAIDGARRGTSVLSLPLTQASIAAGTGLGAELGRLAGETAGFTITGFAGGERPGSFYVGLGTEPAAAECFTAIESAIVAAKNPTAR